MAGDSLRGSLTRVAGEDVGSYAIQQGTVAASANYNLTYVGANLSISQKPITVTADAKSKVYGDADPALTSQITPALVGGDSLSGSLTRVAGENAGSLCDPAGHARPPRANYNLTFVPANLAISLKPLLAQADPQSRAYGATNPSSP